MAKWDDEAMNMQMPPKDIQCATCKHRLRPVTVGEYTRDRSGYAMCDKYDLKPQEVLWEHGKCDEYEEG